MNDPRNLSVEIRRLRELIDNLSDAITRGEKLAKVIESRTVYLEKALTACKNLPTRSNVLIEPSLSNFKRTPKNLYNLLDAVALQWDVTSDQIKSHRRSRVLAYPRFAFCHIAHIVLSYPSTDIGIVLSNRDHTTVLHACDRTVNLLKEDDKFAANYKAVYTAIKASQTPTSQEHH